MTKAELDLHGAAPRQQEPAATALPSSVLVSENRMTRGRRRPATEAETRHALGVLLDELGTARRDLAGLRRAAELAGEQRDRAEAAEARAAADLRGAQAAAAVTVAEVRAGKAPPGASVGAPRQVLENSRDTLAAAIAAKEEITAQVADAERTVSKIEGKLRDAALQAAADFFSICCFSLAGP